MTPRQSIDITTAALRWSTAHARRRALGTKRRLAEKTYKAAAAPVMSGALARMVDASRRATEAKRLERAALRALAKLCATTRDGLAHTEVIEAEPVSPTRPAIGQV